MQTKWIFAAAVSDRHRPRQDGGAEDPQCGGEAVRRANGSRPRSGQAGGAFDRDYIDTEVAYHQAVIEAVNKVLIPGAQNAQVKTALQNTVQTLEGHLQHARNIQTQLPAKRASR
jgi:hypothetical protein